jgi:rRNA processing protein Krr1/Pno1
MLITEKIILIIEGREEYVSEFRAQLYKLIAEHKNLKITIKEREKEVK